MIEDPIQFEVIKNALISCAREMSLALRLTAFSPNIKERRDCSCAIFGSDGKLVAQSKDIPVHLGAMPMSVKSCINEFRYEIKNGSMMLVNDPYSGGSHLPDLTLVAPVFIENDLVAFVANRAHHSDVGGIAPGSMPGSSKNIHEEGIVITPRIVCEKFRLNKESIKDLLKATRTPDERMGDLSAQVAANLVGSKRVIEIANKNGLKKVIQTFNDLLNYSKSMMLKAISKYENRSGSFKDYMDDDGAGNNLIPIEAYLSFTSDKVRINFNKSSKQVTGNVNSPLASTLSAVYYVFITIFGKTIPTNEGCWEMLDVNIPSGCLLNPEYPAAVSAGNVETSQRVVDVILGALSQINSDIVPAASQGTMNNITIGGRDPRTGMQYSFYETIGGGAGASKGMNGTSAIHVHMTNTLNTPIEALEAEYPLRVIEYSIRGNSGGKGKWTGGDGIIREIEILSEDTTLSIQSERRKCKPWGVNDGCPGEEGRNVLFEGKTQIQLDSKLTRSVKYGSRIRIYTPGGAGWGAPNQ